MADNETPDQVARELTALTALGDRVAEEVKRRRALVEAWSPGSKQTVNLPNPDEPNRPTKVAEIRCDGGQTFAKVTDRAAWHAWVKENAPSEYGTTMGGRTGWALDNASTEALLQGYVSAGMVSADDPWSAPDPVQIARTLLDGLEAAGYTLTKVEVVDPEPFVRPVYEDATLKASQKTGAPCTPDGQIPAGVTVDNNPPKAYVKVEKDPKLRLAWLRTQELPELAESLYPELTERND